MPQWLYAKQIVFHIDPMTMLSANVKIHQTLYDSHRSSPMFEWRFRQTCQTFLFFSWPTQLNIKLFVFLVSESDTQKWTQSGSPLLQPRHLVRLLSFTSSKNQIEFCLGIAAAEAIVSLCVFHSIGASVRLLSVRYPSSGIQCTRSTWNLTTTTTAILTVDKMREDQRQWEKMLWTHSINLDAIFLDRIFFCWNVCAQQVEQAIITSQRRLLNLYLCIQIACTDHVSVKRMKNAFFFDVESN